MQSGYLLRNRYRIENRLSAGGFGETYIAIDEDYPNKRRVVVKHLKPQSKDPAVLMMARRLFNDEGLTLANLGEKTDRIPTLYAYFEENQEFYLVQELIEGQTLTQELGTRRLSETEAISIIREILLGLTEVHSSRIVHRDLKPDNIIRRSRNGKLVLIDFGAVKAVRQTNLNPANATQSIAIGTAGYMPTEQAMGYPTSASDIYAVGAIALQCLTGEHPHKLFDENALALRWQHLCTVNDRVANVLSKMVATNHFDRYPNAMETIKAIDSLIKPSVAPTITPTISSPAPTPQPTIQTYQATALNPHAPVTTKAPAQIPVAPVRKKIDRRKLIKWAALGGSGLMGVLVWSKLNEKSTPIPTTITPAAKASADNYSTSALQKYKKGDYQGALANYNSAMQLDPNNYADAYGYYSRGNLKHDKFNDTQGALADFSQAIQLNPKFADAYNSRGILKYVKLNDTQGALTDYNQAIQLNPKYADAYYNRGILKHDKLNDYQGAIDDYSQAIRLDPKNADAYSSRGILKHVKLNDTQGAIEDTKQSAKLYKQEGRQKSYQDAIDRLKEWGDK